jgi:tetratricopeptide (TPR) repeat protein
MKCLARRPAERYASAAALADDLQRFLAGLPILARPTGVVDRLNRWSRRNPRVALLVVLCSLSILAGLLGFLWQRHDNLVTQRILAQESERRKTLAAKVHEVEQQNDRQASAMLRRRDRLHTALMDLERGNLDVKSMYWDNAERAFTRAAAAAPELPTALVERGNLYLSLHLYEFAHADYQQAWSVRPSSDIVLWLRRTLLMRLYSPPYLAAEFIPSSVLARWPYEAKVRLQAQISSQLDGLDANLQALQAACHANDCPPWTRYALATGHARLGQYERAIELAQRVIESDWPARGIAYPLLAIGYHAMGDVASARRTIDLAEQQRQQWVQRFMQPAGPDWIIHQNVQPSWPIEVENWLEFLVTYRDARVALGMSPIDDARMLVLRARGLAGLRRPADAVAAYEQALEQLPNDEGIQLEYHRVRAFRHVTRWKFSAAADDYLYAAQLSPEDVRVWNFAAFACLAARDLKRYAETCESMMQRFGDTQSMTEALKLCDASVAHPAALSDWSQLEQLMERMEPLDRFLSTRYAAAAFYRAGKFARAVATLEQVEKTEPLAARDHCFMAMALHRLGRINEAKRRFEQAGTWMAAANTPGTHADIQAVWGVWTDRPATFALYLETAQQLGLIGTLPQLTPTAMKGTVLTSPGNDLPERNGAYLVTYAPVQSPFGTGGSAKRKVRCERFR